MREQDLKIKIIRLLKRTYPDSFVWKISDRFTAGVPDILFIHDGMHIFLELKTDKGKTTKLQDYTINRINKVGGRAYVVRSAEEVIKCLVK